MTFEQKSMTASEVLEIMAQVVAEFGNSFVYEKVVQGNYPPDRRLLNLRPVAIAEK